MPIPLYVVDAFTTQLFRGNPAAVCLLRSWLPDAQLEDIAAENNLSETAFLVPHEHGWHLRWFTPKVEIPLCGHATLASAFVLAHLYPEQEDFSFYSLSGELRVHRDKDLFTLDFPAHQLIPIPLKDGVDLALDVEVEEVTRAGRYLIAELKDEDTVINFKPDFRRIYPLDCSGLIITARGTQCDFVSRFFAPWAGINEDPVTGSAHCALTPYWTERLKKSKLHARQVSRRGGELFCELKDQRVLMSGYAVFFSKGELQLDQTSRGIEELPKHVSSQG